MKIKKMLAVLSALTMSASVCLTAVPAFAADDNWRAAYAETIKEFQDSAMYNKNATYGLYDVDENGVPELFICPVPDAETADADTLYSDLIFSYTDEVVCYWGGDDFFGDIPFVAQVSPADHLLWLSYEVEDEGLCYIYTEVGGELGEMYLWDSEEGTYDYLEGDDDDFTSLTKEEFEAKLAVYQAKEWVSDFRTASSVDDLSYLYSWGIEEGTTTTASETTTTSNGTTTTTTTNTTYTNTTTSTSSTTTTTTTTTEPVDEEIDYASIYYDFVYNTLLPEYGRAATSATFTPNYNLNNLLGIVSSVMYDFEDDGIEELLVVTLEDENEEGTPSDSAEISTVFYLNLYQADADGDVYLIDRIQTPETHFISLEDSYCSSNEMEMMLSGNAVYYAIDKGDFYGENVDSHCTEYAVYDVVNGKFRNYELTVTAAAVYDSTGAAPGEALEGTLLYADEDIAASYGYTYSGTPYDYNGVNDLINQQFTAHHLDFESATLYAGSDNGAGYLYLDVDIEPIVELMHYRYVYNEVTSNLAQSSENIMVTKSSSQVSSSTTTASATKSAPSAASNNNSTSTASPDTSDKLPLGVGFTALAALTAGIFARRRNK